MIFPGNYGSLKILLNGPTTTLIQLKILTGSLDLKNLLSLIANSLNQTPCSTFFLLRPLTEFLKEKKKCTNSSTADNPERNIDPDGMNILDGIAKVDYQEDYDRGQSDENKKKQIVSHGHEEKQDQGESNNQNSDDDSQREKDKDHFYKKNAAPEAILVDDPETNPNAWNSAYSEPYSDGGGSTVDSAGPHGGNNLLNSVFIGGNNPTNADGSPNYKVLPTSHTDGNAEDHDKGYDKYNAKGASALFFNTNVIGIDMKLITSAGSNVLNTNYSTTDRLQGAIVSTFVTIAIAPKLLFQNMTTFLKATSILPHF
jgi:hypothetical protein